MDKRTYKIDLFQPGDAAGVSKLFTEVYGDGYPVKIVYHPDQLVAAFENHEYIPVLARTLDNEIVGYTALYRSAPNKGLYEIGQALVLPDYRKTPIAGLLFRYAVRAASTLLGIVALFAETVCNHTHTQKAGVVFKNVETAIEVDLMPAEAYEKEKSASGRVSSLGMFRTLIPKPHTVYVPDVYGSYLRSIYSGFDDSRILTASTDELPLGQSTKITTKAFEFARVARITINEAGPDFDRMFEREEEGLLTQDTMVVQVWLKSSWPWIGKVAGTLRNKGYFFGGALPRWFDEDGLLMQKIVGQPNWEGIHLYSAKAMEILAFIKEDWQSVTEITSPFPPS